VSVLHWGKNATYVSLKNLTQGNNYCTDVSTGNGLVTKAWIIEVEAACL